MVSGNVSLMDFLDSIKVVLVGTTHPGNIGAQAKFGLFAGLEATTATLLRFYVLHVLFLPFIIVIFMAVHFWRVRKDGGISGPL